jgi:hypothetical protein
MSVCLQHYFTVMKQVLRFNLLHQAKDKGVTVGAIRIAQNLDKGNNWHYKTGNT